jgi:cation diffusion facilitator CzcD-associated flavoprotein CzcO
VTESLKPPVDRRICVIGAGPCGLTAVKNLLQAGFRDVVCYEEGSGIGGNWAFTDDPRRVSVYECARTISSRRMAAFDDFPMPTGFPDFPAHRQMLAYFTAYATAFRLQSHIRLGVRVERCTPRDDGRWAVRVVANGEPETEIFDGLLVCSGHHREAFVPRYPGTFTGTVMHSSAYKRPDPFRGQRVLVVGGGNSAADIAVDVAGHAARTGLSLREGTYIVPERVFGQPIDTVYMFCRSKLPRVLLRAALRLWLRLAIGRWEEYGLPTPDHAPLEKPPTVNSGALDALRRGRLLAYRGVVRYDGRRVHFTDGTSEEFDAVIMATGFRVGFPFLPDRIADRELYLRMTHPTVPGLFFIGLFQPIGCIWRLADLQARVAAWQLNGRLGRPPDIEARLRDDVAWRHSGLGPSPLPAIEVDYHTLRRQLLRELATARC